MPNPYRDDFIERNATTAFPRTVLIFKNGNRRLVKTGSSSFVIENKVESVDAMGVKSHVWSITNDIKPKEPNPYSKHPDQNTLLSLLLEIYPE